MNSKVCISILLITIALLGCAVQRNADGLVVPSGLAQISEIHMLTVDEGWAWNGWHYNPRSLLHTSDGGLTWQDITPEKYAFAEQGTCFYDAQTAWLPISNETNALNGLLCTRDSGKSWKFLNSTNNPVLFGAFDCHFYTPKCGTGRLYYFNHVTFLESRDAGRIWDIIPLTPPQLASKIFTNTFGVSETDSVTFFPPSTTIITSGDLPNLFPFTERQENEMPKGVIRLSISTNRGRKWRDLELPLPSQYSKCFSIPPLPVFIDRKHIVLPVSVSKIGADHHYEHSNLIFYRSNDGGESWVAQPGALDLGDSWHPDLKAFSPECFVVRTTTNIVMTQDSGRTWNSITKNIQFGEHPDREILQMDFLDPTHGWLIIYPRDARFEGDLRLYRTSDAGKTWTKLPARIANDRSARKNL